MRKDEYLHQQFIKNSGKISKEAYPHVVHYWVESGFLNPNVLVDEHNRFYSVLPDWFTTPVDEVNQWNEKIEDFYNKFLSNGYNVEEGRFYKAAEITKFVMPFLDSNIDYDMPSKNNGGVLFKKKFGKGYTLKKCQVFDTHSDEVTKEVTWLFIRQLAWKISSVVMVYFEYGNQDESLDDYIQSLRNSRNLSDRAFKQPKIDCICISKRYGVVRVRRFGWTYSVTGKKKQRYKCTDPNLKVLMSFSSQNILMLIVSLLIIFLSAVATDFLCNRIGIFGAFAILPAAIVIVYWNACLWAKLGWSDL